MRINMNFIKAMPCMCARSPSFSTSHFGRLLLSILTALILETSMRIILCIIFTFRQSKMVVRWQDVAEVPSFGIFFIRSWLFAKLKTKAYIEQYRAYRTKNWMWEEQGTYILCAANGKCWSCKSFSIIMQIRWPRYLRSKQQWLWCA